MPRLAVTFALLAACLAAAIATTSATSTTAASAADAAPREYQGASDAAESSAAAAAAAAAAATTATPADAADADDAFGVFEALPRGGARALSSEPPLRPVPRAPTETENDNDVPEQRQGYSLSYNRSFGSTGAVLCYCNAHRIYGTPETQTSS